MNYNKSSQRKPKITKTWQKAMDLGLTEIPTEILGWGGKIYWDVSKPLLHRYYNLGLSYLKKGDYENALWIFSHCTELNDSMISAIYRAIDCYFYFSRPTPILDLYRRFDSFSDGYIYYSAILANLMLGDKLDAEEISVKAIKEYPKFAKLITQKRHKDHYDLRYKQIFADSKEEAQEYWNHQSKYWIETENAIDQLRVFYQKRRTGT